MMHIKNQNTAPVIDRAIDVIEFISLREKDMALSKIMENVDIPRQSLIRILNTLCSLGFLDKSGKKGLYRVVPKFLYNNIIADVGNEGKLFHLISDTG